MLSNKILCCTLWLAPSEMMRRSRSLHVDRYGMIWAMSKHWLKCNEEITRSHMIGLYQNSEFIAIMEHKTHCLRCLSTNDNARLMYNYPGRRWKLIGGEWHAFGTSIILCDCDTTPPYRATLIIAETWQSMYQCNGRCLVGGYSLLFISLGNGRRTDSSWWSVGKGCRNRYAFLLSVVLVLGQN